MGVLLCRSYAQLSLGLNGFRLIREPIREVDLDTQLCVSSQVHGSMLFGFMAIKGHQRNTNYGHRGQPASIEGPTALQNFLPCDGKNFI